MSSWNILPRPYLSLHNHVTNILVWTRAWYYGEIATTGREIRKRGKRQYNCHRHSRCWRSGNSKMFTSSRKLCPLRHPVSCETQGPTVEFLWKRSWCKWLLQVCRGKSRSLRVLCTTIVWKHGEMQMDICVLHVWLWLGLGILGIRGNGS